MPDKNKKPVSPPDDPAKDPRTLDPHRWSGIGVVPRQRPAKLQRGDRHAFARAEVARRSYAKARYVSVTL